MATLQTSGAAAALKSLHSGVFITLHSRLDRGGALQARKLSSGAVQLYWRYSLAGKTSREPIGVYDPAAPPKKLLPSARGYGIAAALEKCRVLAEVHAARAHSGGLREAKVEERKTFLAQKTAESREVDAHLVQVAGCLCRAPQDPASAQPRRCRSDLQAACQRSLADGGAGARGGPDARPGARHAASTDRSRQRPHRQQAALVPCGRRTNAPSTCARRPRSRWSSRPSASPSTPQPRRGDPHSLTAPTSGRSRRTSCVPTGSCCATSRATRLPSCACTC